MQWSDPRGFRTRAGSDPRGFPRGIEAARGRQRRRGVTVVGSPVLHEARLEGRLDGAEVYGVLLGPDDRQIGTFTGYRARRSLTGTYTFANGDSGTWTWSGAVPE